MSIDNYSELETMSKFIYEFGFYCIRFLQLYFVACIEYIKGNDIKHI